MNLRLLFIAAILAGTWIPASVIWPAIAPVNLVLLAKEALDKLVAQHGEDSDAWIQQYDNERRTA